ncbi:mannonate dehydratase [Aliiglaciecola sp. 2_MG-2023]|uniref:mannonate dehydratase n=1 Tax=unclassified Aliiglaciecola TaxID=2593648 RepID=UPI0026E36FC5|nr:MULTISPECIES: mannonate dehydratase [unclassified Aliiglaciecola]MDO6710633.1 mannonate dehydratase [Aliiglaciecola sp. 2_MG-2023]MDO6754280.1 mannonate dehydratase [Aliiglaciecola sp. 1_MG-2023]
MQQTWRWFGADDSVSLTQIKQAGATGVVSALHQIPTGEVWSYEDILERKRLIEEQGLQWSVVESVPVHNDIKSRQGNYKQYIKNYKETIKNLSSAGIYTLCYNFMPVVDWTRTNLNYQLPNQAQALRFEMTEFAAYDIFILKRKNASVDYTPEILSAAKHKFAQMNAGQIRSLEKNIIAGLPGGEGSYTRSKIKQQIELFIDLGENNFRENLIDFLKDVIPVAEEYKVKMCIHPDDPPFPLFGLPRVVSTADDARAIISAVPSHYNGLTFCAGSFGARADNDLVAMVKEFGSSIHFVHLRNVIRYNDGSFYESDHLTGDNDMISLIKAIVLEERRRKQQKCADSSIPIRPDHGHLMGDEINRENINPGYSYAGRMKSLAELRGVIFAIEQIN